MATIHLTKGAPKSTRLDAVTMRKRAATKGDVVVEVKPGEEVISVNVGWTVDRYVDEVKEVKRTSSPNGSKPAKKAKAPARTSAARSKPAAKAKTAKKKK
jgi:hypothetical protein